MAYKVNILVVNDADDFFSKQVTTSLRQQVGINYAVQTISSKQLSDEPWEDNTTLVVFPGSQSQLQILSDKTSNKVKSFVQNGGGVFGLGTGAAQLVSSHYLPLGTVHTLQSSEPVHTLSIPSTKQTFTSYLDSSNAFSFQSSNQDVISLAETTDKHSVIAAYKFNKGTIILSGSQIECNPNDITSVDTKYKASLYSSNKDREALFRSLLEKLGIKTAEFKHFTPPPLSSIYLVNNNSVVLHQLKETISKENKDMKFTYATPNLQFYKEEDKVSEEPSENLLPIVISTSLDANKCSFDSTLYSKLLTTNIFGKTLLYSETVTSTQAILTENFMLFRKFVDGLVFTANRQVKGVGRGNNIWVSPEGCLMFSIQISHRDPSTLLFLQYLMGIAIVDSIRTRPGYEDLDIRIKWPNDIYYKKNKLAGVLVSSNYFDGIFSVVIGVGLNLSNEKPTSCVNSVIMDYNKEHGVNLKHLSKEEMLSGIINKFEKMYKVFEKQGFKLFEDLYYKYWLHNDQIVNLETEDEGIVKVIIKGLKPSGFLEASSADYSKTYELYPDGNSFDIFHGLIKKKN